MATFRHLGTVGEYGVKFVEGMVSRGYDPDFAQRCFKQIEGFGSYGFPESHAISFALLVYASAWIKRHWPDVFCAALLNSQPMGFYQPAQLVRDAREHGVEVRPPDVLASAWDCTLEPHDPSTDEEPRLKPVRLGLRQVRGLQEDEARRLIAAREAGARTLGDLARGGRLSRRTLELLAEADAFRGLGLDRRAALWAVKGLAQEGRIETSAPLVAAMPSTETQVELPFMSLPQHVAEDYRTTSLSLKAHPCGFFRADLERLGAAPAAAMREARHGRRLSIGGLVLIRQRPGTAKGVTFMTLEDETGPANIVVWRDVFEANRRLVMTASFLVVHGRLQRVGEVIHLVAERFTDLSARLAELRQADAGVAPRLVRSRDFH
jgi:error-prone DNA polymerase